MPSDQFDDIERRSARSGHEAEIRVRLDKGIRAARRGWRNEAWRLLEAVLELDPDNEEAWLWLAAMTSDRELARAIYQRVLTSHPSSSRAHDGLRNLDEQGTREEKLTPSADEDMAVADAMPSPPRVQGRIRGRLRGGVSRKPSEGSDDKTDEPEPVARPSDTADRTRRAAPGKGRSHRKRAVGVRTGQEASDRRVDHDLDQNLDLQGDDASLNDRLNHRDSGEECDEFPDRFRPIKLAGAPLAGGVARRITLRDLIMIAMLSFVVLGTAAILILSGNQVRAEEFRGALGIIVDTPTLTPTPDVTPTTEATPTVKPTETPLPSPTFTPTVTPTPSPTPTPAWVTERYLPLPLDEKWIEVDLTEQMLYAYDGTELVYTAVISSGKAGTPTVEGKYRIVQKLESQLMTGPGYYLPGVSYVQYFYRGFALHGAYWHDDWGAPTSHGCVNLKEEDAEWLYRWTDPQVPDGVLMVHSSEQEPGTWVIIHQ